MLTNGHHTSRTSLLAAAVVAAALALSGCAGATSGASDAPAASESFNAADVAFAQMMIPHHEQAVEMSDIILDTDGVDQDVVDLATGIKAAQEPEIQQMEAWLDAWGADRSMADMDHGTDGMMSEEDMSALEDATGPEAGRLFLQQMLIHHEGAIAMARTELKTGKNAEAKTLAEAIVAAQEAEIQDFKDLLAAS
ncbi:DUF305 domain-containing protein [Cryobacterium sp. TMT1-2-1]|uniref:DUF305 domain-containing protein n=1 Tax=Cryobacterium sp. TMT1-2-1 TaxID=1259232 RepID=UPI00106ABBC2|nr:DUF305 domain-containing protein [Cryobacterium sp. TMT1-2-1]TFD41695.1 DUF305 domain-containing protein [Cryobacterium sp. TMT1-2-1]